MAKTLNLNPISHITIDTVGQPGQRVFYLQASRGSELVTLVIEKEHALALASSLDTLIAELEARFPRPSTLLVTDSDLVLRHPLEPIFHVGQLGLGYDESIDRVVLIAYQIANDTDEEADIARFWGTREQMKRLRDQALLAIEGGRPVCDLCGEFIQADGHLCTRKNGHGNHPRFDS